MLAAIVEICEKESAKNSIGNPQPQRASKFPARDDGGKDSLEDGTREREGTKKGEGKACDLGRLGRIRDLLKFRVGEFSRFVWLLFLFVRCTTSTP